MCTLEISSFAQETAGPLARSGDYLAHVKEEVLSSIPLEEAGKSLFAQRTSHGKRGVAKPRLLAELPDIPALAL